MARMHSRKKGKSSSRPPLAKENPKWVELKPKEVEELVVKMGREGFSKAKTGLLLRDTYGVPSVKKLCGKTISQIISEKTEKKEYPEDFMDLLRKAVNLRKHLAQNNRDRANKRAIILVESKIKRLEKYYKNKGVLPQGFYYDPETAALMMK